MTRFNPIHRKLAGITVAAGLIFMISALSPAPSFGGGKDCKRTAFKTALVKDACASGGQKAAKKAMKKWVKAVKSKKAGLECATCHTTMAPGYELSADGLKLYKELGGK